MGAGSVGGQLSFQDTQVIEVGGHKICKLQQISHGGYGSIWKCSSSTTNSLLALKEMNLKMDLAFDSYEKEIYILNKITQLGFEGSIRMIASQIHCQKKHKKMGRMLLQLGQETLLDEFNSRDFTEKDSIAVLRDLSKSLKQLHSIGITHFDIKPENIIKVGDSWKLCDFGSALTQNVNVSGMNRKQRRQFQEYVDHNTTQIYSAPEMIELKGDIGTSADIWMLGCIGFILTFGYQPFTKTEEILSGKVNYPFEGELTDLVRQMLSVNPQKRPSASAIHEKLTQKNLSESNISTQEETSIILQMVFA